MNITIEDNGNKRVIENVVAYKIWTPEDFGDCCDENNYFPSHKLINAAINSVGDCLNDCLDEEWNTIKAALKDNYQEKLDAENMDIGDIARYDESIAKYTIDGDYCPRYSIAVKDSTDISGMLEETLHRIQSMGFKNEEDVIYAIMGARRLPDDLTDDECWTYIDSGYGIRGHIMFWDIITNAL